MGQTGPVGLTLLTIASWLFLSAAGICAAVTVWRLCKRAPAVGTSFWGAAVAYELLC